MALRFEWDPKKAETNLAKHGVSFEQAVTVFADPLARIFLDEEDSIDEVREIIIGHSAQHDLILVNFISGKDQIRISAHARRHALSAMTMKKTLARKKRPGKNDELRSEYRFDYSKSKPNRFAQKMSEGTVAVVLEPDVAKVFRSSAVVNALLRSIISAMPPSNRRSRVDKAT